MEIVKIRKINEVYIQIDGESSVLMEIRQNFMFDVPGASFSPSYRLGIWDGKIYLFNLRNRYLYFGLFRKLIEFLESRKYRYEIENPEDFCDIEFSIIQAKDFIESLNIPHKPREHQLIGFIKAIRKRRLTIISPTGSGKSFLIYLITKYYNMKTLVIVPTLSLVHQMENDFREYGCKDSIQKIFSGNEKKHCSNIVISTWQSIYKFPKSWFSYFDVIINDECHLTKAKSLTGIMEKTENCKYKFGLTGTLDKAKAHRFVIEGLFGPIEKLISSYELMEKKILASLEIKCLIINYPKEIKELMKGNSYKEEIEYIISNPKRNKFIKNLALSLKGNTLILFQYVEKHGQILYDMLKRHFDRNVYFIHGQVDGEIRERIRKIVEKDDSAIIIASYATFSTGVNIKNLHNVIFASPSKSKIRNLQSIGRALRVSESKTNATLYDIVDDFSFGDFKNYTLLHFYERLKIYKEEKFQFKTYKINIT